MYTKVVLQLQNKEVISVSPSMFKSVINVQDKLSLSTSLSLSLFIGFNGRKMICFSMYITDQEEDTKNQETCLKTIG